MSLFPANQVVWMRYFTVCYRIVFSALNVSHLWNVLSNTLYDFGRDDETYWISFWLVSGTPSHLHIVNITNTHMHSLLSKTCIYHSAKSVIHFEWRFISLSTMTKPARCCYGYSTKSAKQIEQSEWPRLRHDHRYLIVHIKL